MKFNRKLPDPVTRGHTRHKTAPETNAIATATVNGINQSTNVSP